MKPRKLDIGFARFPYGGVGGSQQEHPDVADWLVSTVIACKTDERIGRIAKKRFADCPITMTRNAAVEWAKKEKLDVLIMVDSDQAPDMYVGTEPKAKPFFQSSFDHLYAHYEKGPVTIFAPYCGPPGHPITGGFENVYVFHWSNFETGRDADAFRLDQYTRNEASQLSGIREAAAGPTGLCMIDMRCFEHIKPPYFYYQFENEGPACPMCGHHEERFQAEKASTEDVTFFRDLSLAGCHTLGYNPVLCNWDAWAGHWKPWCVGKPTDLTAGNVSHKLREALSRPDVATTKLINVKASPDIDLASIPKARQPTPAEAKQPINRINGVDAVKSVPEGTTWFESQSEEVWESLKPGPHHFKPEANMSGGEREYLASIIQREAMRAARAGKLLRIVELGSWAGRSAELMASEASHYCDFELHCVDHFKGAVKWHIETAEQFDVEAEFRKNTERFGRSIVLHRNDTHAAALNWAKQDDTSIDLLFIDADHDYEACLRDIQDWSKFVVNEGVIIGHDYHHLFPGVKRAVHETFGYDVFSHESLWVVLKGTNGQPMRILPIESEKLNGKAEAAVSGR